MGGRVALELGMRHPERVEGLVLMTPSLAWRGSRPWVGPLKLIRPELGLLQPTPRPVVEAFVRRFVPGAESSWVASGVDEFLRAFLNPRGRVAFYAAARNIYLEDPDKFWSRLEALQARSLFLWGRRDTLVPIGFARHVRQALPEARHVEIDCGHVPQLERPRAAHGAIARFLRGDEAAHNGRSRAGSGAGAGRRAGSSAS
jgi:pimeloyl-ACP methyl ester carboxylesterase